MPQSGEPTKLLTPEDLRKLLAIEAQLPGMLKALPQPLPFPAELDTSSQLSQATQALESSLEVRRLFEANDWTARDYLLTLLATVGAITGEAPFVSLPGPEWTSNRQLLSSPPPDLAGPLAQWKRTRLQRP